MFGLTRSRPNYSAIKGGIIRSNPSGFGARGGKMGNHGLLFGRFIDRRQVESEPGPLPDNNPTII